MVVVQRDPELLQALFRHWLARAASPGPAAPRAAGSPPALPANDGNDDQQLDQRLKPRRLFTRQGSEGQEGNGPLRMELRPRRVPRSLDMWPANVRRLAGFTWRIHPIRKISRKVELLPEGASAVEVNSSLFGSVSVEGWPATGRAPPRHKASGPSSQTPLVGVAAPRRSPSIRRQVPRELWPSPSY